MPLNDLLIGKDKPDKPGNSVTKHCDRVLRPLKDNIANHLFDEDDLALGIILTSLFLVYLVPIIYVFRKRKVPSI